MRGRGLLVLLLAAALLFGLCGCGSAPDEVNAGVYHAAWLEYHGVAFPVEELFPGGLTLQLDSRGGGTLLAEGEEGSIRWSLEGSTLSLDIAGDLSHGTLEDGILRLDLLDQGILVTLVKEGASLPEEEPDEAVLAVREALLGDWYGWWRVTNSEGTLPDMWYDCFAAVEEDERGALTLRLWDEGSARDDVLGMVTLDLSGGDARSKAGWFWFADIGEGEWALTPEDGWLRFDGHHDAGDERFDYSVCLRPWGDLWESADADDLPFYFESWYLPLVESGGEMPDALTLPADETN